MTVWLYWFKVLATLSSTGLNCGCRLLLLKAKVMLPGMFKVMLSPWRTTSTPEPARLWRRAASWRSWYAPMPAPASPPTPTPTKARWRRSTASPPLSSPATAPMPAPIRAPVRVWLGSFGSLVCPVYVAQLESRIAAAVAATTAVVANVRIVDLLIGDGLVDLNTRKKIGMNAWPRSDGAGFGSARVARGIAQSSTKRTRRVIEHTGS